MLDFSFTFHRVLLIVRLILNEFRTNDLIVRGLFKKSLKNGFPRCKLPIYARGLGSVEKKVIQRGSLSTTDDDTVPLQSKPAQM